MRTTTKPHAQPMAPDAALPPVVYAAPTIVPCISRSTTTTVTTHTAVIEATVITWHIDPWVQTKDVPNAPKGPTPDEMEAALLQYVQRHQPTLLYTCLQQAFADLDWVLVFAPPYTPSFQPAELLWAHVKGYVAYKHRNDRTLNDVIELLRDAFQGPADAKYRSLIVVSLLPIATGRCSSLGAILSSALMNIWAPVMGSRAFA